MTVFQVFALLLIGVNIGLYLGKWVAKDAMQKECVQRAVAHYDTVTKEFVWDAKPKVVEEVPTH